jgi:hypothetical protein
MKKAFIISLIGIFICLNLAQAVANVCSGHGGVNCAAGPDPNDDSVICYDGWKDSSVRYDSMIKCQIPLSYPICIYPIPAGCTVQDDYGQLNSIIGSMTGVTTFAKNMALEACQEEIDEYRHGLEEYESCLTGYMAGQQSRFEQLVRGFNDYYIDSRTLSCPATLEHSYYDEAFDSCVCDEGYIRMGDECAIGDLICINQYGPYAIYEDGDCSCREGYSFDVNHVKCELSDYYKSGWILGSSYSESNPLGFEPGWLIKNKEYAEVFQVDEDICLHWLVNEQAAIKYFGVSWNHEGNIHEYYVIPDEYEFCDNLE